MGGQNTKEKKEEFNANEFYKKIDDIATNYILTMDFKSMKKLNEKEYCDKLVILTSDILEKKLNSMEVKYLLQRTQFGGKEEMLKDEYINEMKKQKYYFYVNEETNKFDKFNVTLNEDEMKKEEKVRVCIGIAKFYIIIAHLFASIVKTINPVYSYKEGEEEVEIDYFNKERIPSNVEVDLKRISLCDNRLRALKENIQVDENDNIYFKANNCEINIEKETLNNEPGIYEFQNLYMDDNYDYTTGEFKSKSEKSEEIYRNDLKRFYTEFTGNEIMPDEIKRFSDIKLRYYKNEECENNEEKIYENNGNSDLFKLYAKNIREMMSNSIKRQQKLLEILNLIFISNEEEKIKINTELNEELLYALVNETRKIIMDLYISCEKDYVRGIEIYKELVKEIEYKNTERQIENLEKTSNEMLQSYYKNENDNIFIT